MYYSIKPDIYYDFGVMREPRLPGIGVSFLLGAKISTKLDTPLIFDSNFTKENPPKAFIGLSIPVWSDDLIALLLDMGIDNFETYAAKVRNDESGLDWPGYKAVNVIGMVSRTDMSKSQKLELFRLAENPATLIVHERVIARLKQQSPGNWGITAIPIES